MPTLAKVVQYIFGVTTQIEPKTKFTVAKVSVHGVHGALSRHAHACLAHHTRTTPLQWYYLTGFIITSTLTWVLRDYANDWFVENARAFSLCQVGGPGACAHTHVRTATSGPTPRTHFSAPQGCGSPAALRAHPQRDGATVVGGDCLLGHCHYHTLSFWVQGSLQYCT
jgi:hypothetical protein